MPYALSNLAEGKVPSARYVPDASQATPQEVVVSDADYRDDWVWDAANRRLRPKGAAENLAEAKRAKKNEGTNRMHREIRGLYSEVAEVDGAWVAEAVVDIVSDPRGARVGGVRSNRDKRARFHAAVDAATTQQGIDGVAWETV